MDFERFRKAFVGGLGAGMEWSIKNATPEQRAEVLDNLDKAEAAVASARVVVDELITNMLTNIKDTKSKLAEQGAGSNKVTPEQKFAYVYERLDEGSKEYYLQHKAELLGVQAWVLDAAYDYYKSEEGQ